MRRAISTLGARDFRAMAHRRAIELFKRAAKPAKINLVYWLASSEGPGPSDGLRSIKVGARARLLIWCRHALLPQYQLARTRRRLYLPPSPRVKIITLRRYAREYKLQNLIETGTYLGDTVAALAPTFARCFTIEIVPALYERSRQRLEPFDNVDCILGDSAVVLPGLVQRLNEPSLFWLDAHASGGKTFNSGKGPLISELEAIYSTWPPGHVVLIDDARGHDLVAIQRFCEPRAKVEVRNDIIRLTPIR